MSATYDPATDIGKVRRDIGDRVVVPESAAHFTDAEIQSFLDDGVSVKAAAGLALYAWAAELSSGDELVDTGSWKGDRRDVVAKMARIANTYFDLVGYKPAKKPTLKIAYPQEYQEYLE